MKKKHVDSEHTQILNLPQWHCIVGGRGKKRKEKKSLLPSWYWCLNAAAGISLWKGGRCGRGAPSSPHSALWLISREAGGAVRSHSLIGEHMSGPICHWLPWEWHQRWPLDPGWRRNASAIVFHYRGGRARTPDGYVQNGKIGKLKKAFRPVFDLSCFRLLRRAFMKWVFDPWAKPLSSHPCVSRGRPPKDVKEDKTGIVTPTRSAPLHLALFSARYSPHACISVCRCVN